MENIIQNGIGFLQTVNKKSTWCAFGQGTLLSVLLVSSGSALAGGANSERILNTSGGLQTDASDGLKWWIGSNSQFQVNLGGEGQVYNDLGTPMTGSMFNSVYLRVVEAGTPPRIMLYENNDAGYGVEHLVQVSQTDRKSVV